MNNSSLSEELIGIVFCGGQSIRMGTDKGLITTDGLSWAEIAANKLRNLHLKVWYSINPAQKPAYSYLADPFFFITDSIDIKGPLGGLLSVHKKFHDKNMLIIACDMLDIEEDTIHQLILSAIETNFMYEAYLYINKRDFEPLLAIYSSKGLARIYSLYLTESLIKFSMKHVLEQLHVYSVEINQDKSLEFKNYNCTEDLKI